MKTRSSVSKLNFPLIVAGLVGLALVCVGSEPSSMQAFSSGSDGSDGALTVAANQGTIIFDPTDAVRWGRVLDPDGDGVYNFITITINTGSTLRLQGDKVNRPVFWLASGDVTISGILDLSGATGSSTVDLNFRRQVAIPGSGGYAGGAGGTTATPSLRTAGEGPGGGTGGADCDGTKWCGKGGTFSGNRYLIPLVGGSGGEGATWNNSTYYGGGAGGGAILIASSTTVAVLGKISANGGNGANTFGGGGAGGAIRLVAPDLSGSGHLAVLGGTGRNGNTSDSNSGGPGLVRLEGFTISNSLVLDAGGAFSGRGTPVDSSTLRPANSLRVTAIDGISVPANPSGSFILPDVTINKTGPVSVAIQASGVPPGTVVTLQVYPETLPDLTIVNLPTVQVALVGTVQSSTATFSFTFPYGFSRGFVRATWVQ